MVRPAAVWRDRSAPTPIVISRQARWVVVSAGAALVLMLLWRAPSVPSLLLGGVSLAIVLSFPVKLLSRVMPRGLAIALGFVVLGGLLLLLVVAMVPVIVEQSRNLAQAAPQIARRLDARVPSVLEWLGDWGLPAAPPDRLYATLRRGLLAAVQRYTGRLVGGLGAFLVGAIDGAVALFGVVFIAAYLLADAPRFQVAALRATPPRYRRDAWALGTAFSDTLSRYLAGLAVSLAVQGGLSVLALALLRVPYALLLGAWVAVTALVPFLGAWIGAVPAVMLALTVSPGTALLTAAVFLAIQQLEGNVLTPRLQGEAVRTHPILVLLAVIAGSELAGLAGVVFAVPALAVARVLYDFFRARLRVAPSLVTVAGGEPDASRARRAATNV